MQPARTVFSAIIIQLIKTCLTSISQFMIKRSHDPEKPEQIDN